MAIGPIHLAWLKRVAARGCFRDLRKLIDLGPQDIQVDRALLSTEAHKLVSPAQAEKALAGIFDGQVVRRDAQRDFYSLFGLTEYASLDAEDERATYKWDLNHPVSGLPEFDVVTNFGTTEHVFNIGEAFRTIHQLTRPGGVSLHAVPSFAFINHGFYNVHPNALVELARANGYDLVDFSYVDHTFHRNHVLGRQGLDEIDFDALPIQLSDMENSQTFMIKVVETFHRNLVSPETQAVLTEIGLLPGEGKQAAYPGPRYQICYVFDLIFVALRRPKERRPFVMPMQDPSGVPPLERAGLASRSLAWAKRVKTELHRWYVTSRI